MKKVAVLLVGILLVVGFGVWRDRSRNERAKDCIYYATMADQAGDPMDRQLYREVARQEGCF